MQLGLSILILIYFGYMQLNVLGNEWVRGCKDGQIITGEILIRTMKEPRDSNIVVSVKTLASPVYVNYLYRGYAISDATDNDYIDKNGNLKVHFKYNIFASVIKLTAEQQTD